MGGAMAANLAADGFDVVGYDPDAQAAARFTGIGGRLLTSPAEVAASADVVVVSVASSAALHDVISGDRGLHEFGRPGLVVVEASTLPLADKEAARAALAVTGARLLDCPISGTGAQAVTRDLVFLASGDPDALASVVPLLERLARSVKLVGEFGSGSKIKFIANLLVSINNVATAEAMLLAARADLDPALVYEVLYESAASSRIFQLRAPLMIEGTYQPPTAKISMFLKDLEIISSFAGQVGSPTPLLSTVRPIYDAAMTQGMADLDGAAVYLILQQMKAAE
jgi:3-hydroxyisobutyrate dehydrogenase-like beta-hydroxyacid dehydrogenase